MRNQIDFERFSIDRGLDTAKKVNGDYREYDTYLAFETWQASRSVALESAAEKCIEISDSGFMFADAIRAMKGE